MQYLSAPRFARKAASKQNIQMLYRNIKLILLLLVAVFFLIKFGNPSSSFSRTKAPTSSSHSTLKLLRHHRHRYLSFSTKPINTSHPASLHKEDASHLQLADVPAAREEAKLSTPVRRLEPKISNWDEQRHAKNSGLAVNHSSTDNILLVSGSRPKSCNGSHGDHYLMKSMKNKMDYCRLHGIKIFYNMAQVDDALTDYWSKLPLLRSLMLSHPEVEWLWWMDSDAMFTDMAFKLPMDKYKEYNLVLHGWGHEVYVKKSWIGLNTGIFLLRNCQWSLDLIDSWVVMGAEGKVRDEAGELLSKMLTGRPPSFEADDQSALVFLLVTQQEVWESKVYLEYSYCLHGYWDVLVDKFEEMMESSHPGYGDDRWPFVTHFVGCKPCGSKKSYGEERCLSQMERAFNFADNQVLQHYGFAHTNLSSVKLKRMVQMAEPSNITHQH